MGISMFDFIVSCPAAFKPCVLWTASQLQLVLAMRILIAASCYCCCKSGLQIENSFHRLLPL